VTTPTPEPNHSARLERLFDDALDVPAPDRAAFLDDVCGEDADLRREVEALLAADAGLVTLPDSRAPRDEPSYVGRFRILEVLGQGGMGIVHVGYDDRLDRRVAIKLLHGGASAAGTRRLLREAQAMAQVAHPNVVPIYEVIEVGDRVAVVMELVEGRTVSAWLRQEDRPWRAVVDIFCSAGRGLAAAHAAGLVHRDFKSDNVLVGDDGRVRVLDFGLARGSTARLGESADGALHAPAVRGVDIGLTAEGALLGTPSHMAPEQFNGAAIGPATDQFAFSVALYRALYRSAPFPGGDVQEIRDSVLGGRLAVPEPGDVPPGVWIALRRGLDRVPADRWSSIDALVEELERQAREDPEGDLSRGARSRRMLMLIVAPCGTLSSLMASAATAETGLTRSELVLHALGAAMVLAAGTFLLKKRLLVTAVDRKIALLLNALFWVFALHRWLGTRTGDSVTDIFVSEGLMIALGTFLASLTLARWMAGITALAVAYAVIATLVPAVAGHGFNALLTISVLVSIHFWGRDRHEPSRPWVTEARVASRAGMRDADTSRTRPKN